MPYHPGCELTTNHLHDVSAVIHQLIIMITLRICTHNLSSLRIIIMNRLTCLLEVWRVQEHESLNFEWGKIFGG
jgi:hypothetical protein